MELALIKSTLIRATVPQDTLGENVKQVPNHDINYKWIQKKYDDAQTAKLQLNNQFLHDSNLILVYPISYMKLVFTIEITIMVFIKYIRFVREK